MAVSKEPLAPTAVPAAVQNPNALLRFQVTGGTLFDAETGERVVQFYGPGQAAIGRPRRLASSAAGLSSSVHRGIPSETWKSFARAMEGPFSTQAHVQQRNERKLRMIAILVPCILGWLLASTCIANFLLRRNGNNNDAPDLDAAVTKYTGLVFLLLGLCLLWYVEQMACQSLHKQTLLTLEQTVDQWRPTFQAHGWTMRLEVAPTHGRKDDLGRSESFIVFEPYCYPFS
jgi:hypothetical protein